MPIVLMTMRPEAFWIVLVALQALGCVAGFAIGKRRGVHRTVRVGLLSLVSLSFALAIAAFGLRWAFRNAVDVSTTATLVAVAVPPVIPESACLGLILVFVGALVGRFARRV